VRSRVQLDIPIGLMGRNDYRDAGTAQRGGNSKLVSAQHTRRLTECCGMAFSPIWRHSWAPVQWVTKASMSILAGGLEALGVPT